MKQEDPSYVIDELPAGKLPPECLLTIDISWVDWAYKSSSCDVMYCRQRRHLYYGGEILKYYLPPSTAALPS
jgi:hypothetical protein